MWVSTSSQWLHDCTVGFLLPHYLHRRRLVQCKRVGVNLFSAKRKKKQEITLQAKAGVLK